VRFGLRSPSSPTTRAQVQDVFHLDVLPVSRQDQSYLCLFFSSVATVTWAPSGMHAKRRAPQVLRGLNTSHWVLPLPRFLATTVHVYRVHTVVRGNDDTACSWTCRPRYLYFIYKKSYWPDHNRDLNQLYQAVTVHRLEEMSKAMCARAVL
jgi:hypothetical protein